jgi:hypothetical protein
MRVQQEQIGQHKATIDQLFQAQLADPEDIQTSAYIVGESVLRKLGQGSDGSYSWARIKPLPRHERNFILCTHAGTFAGFPPDLDLVTATKALKEIQAAKLSLSTFATQEVAKYMARNAHTVKMTGTVYSRIIEMREELEARRAEDDSFKEDLLVPMENILSFLSTLDEAASGAMDIAIDNQTLMRTAVSRRLEEAIGVAHLRPEAGKKAREDFLSSKTLSLIEAATTRSEDLSWAAEGQKRLKNQRSSHGYRSQKPPGAEKTHGIRALSPAVRAKGRRARQTPRASMRCRLNSHPRAAKTLPKEGHRVPRVKGPGAAPQPRRRSDRFDSTLGFPGEGPSQVAGGYPKSTSGVLGQWATPKGHISSFPGGLPVCSHTTEIKRR